VNVFGYPADQAPGTLWGGTRLIREVQPRKLVYNIAVVGGKSGCPVFVKDGERRSVVGIHTYGDLCGNTAVRVTPTVCDNIRAWGAEAATAPPE
jgi:V8-like Glu-specific endopeptidase